MKPDYVEAEEYRARPRSHRRCDVVVSGVETTTQRVLGRANERLVLRVQRTPDSSHLILSSRFRGKPFAPDAMIAISARDAQGREKNVTRRLRSTVNAVREVQLRRFSTRWRSVPPSMAGCSSAGAFFERDQSGERCLRVNRKRRRSDGRKRPVRPSGNPPGRAIKRARRGTRRTPAERPLPTEEPSRGNVVTSVRHGHIDRNLSGTHELERAVGLATKIPIDGLVGSRPVGVVRTVEPSGRPWGLLRAVLSRDIVTNVGFDRIVRAVR